MTDPYAAPADGTTSDAPTDFPADPAAFDAAPEPDAAQATDVSPTLPPATSFDLGQAAAPAEPVSLDLPPLPDMPDLPPAQPAAAWPLGDIPFAVPAASAPSDEPPAPVTPPPAAPAFDVYQPPVAQASQPQAPYTQPQAPYAQQGYQQPYTQQPYTQQPSGYPPQPYYPAAMTNPDPNRPGSPDSTTMASLAHWGAIVADVITGGFLGFLPPLIVMLTKGNTDAFVREHAKESLNFQITVVICVIICWILTAVVIGIIGLIAILVLNLVWGISAAMAANRGGTYRYPLCFRFVK